MTDQSFHLTTSALPGFEAIRVPSHAKGCEGLTGHRARLRDQFMQGGPDAMPDEDVLELVLFRAIPRREVKSLARRLLFEFGDFNRVMTSSPSRLAEVQGVGSAVIQELKIVQAAAQRLARAKIMHREVVSSWDALLEYCQSKMAHLLVEQCRVLYLDRKNALIADEVQGSGTVSHVSIYPREIVKRALELDASACILVHNHPTGDPTPSQEDIDMTKAVAAATEALDITLHDHLVIGQSGHVSFRAENLL